HVLIIGGSSGKTGAPIMSGLAALRTGAGWASVAVPPQERQRHADGLLTVTFENFFDGTRIDSQALAGFLYERHVKPVLVGPGTMSQVCDAEVLGVLSKWQRKTNGGLVIDAGSLAGILNLLEPHLWLPERTLLTPH